MNPLSFGTESNAGRLDTYFTAYRHFGFATLDEVEAAMWENEFLWRISERVRHDAYCTTLTVT